MPYLKFPETLGNDNESNYISMVFKKLNFVDDVLEDGNETIEDIIYLPIPQGLFREYYDSSYNSEDISIGGEIGKSLSDMYNGVVDNYTDEQTTKDSEVTKGTISSLKNIFSSTTNILDSKLERELMETEHKTFRAAMQGSGYGFNPNKALMYTGPEGFRTFSFEWNFTTRITEEIDSIKAIEKKLRKATLPRIAQATKVSDLIDIPKPAKEKSKSVIVSSIYELPIPFEMNIFVDNDRKNSKFQLPYPFVITSMQIIWGDKNSEKIKFFKEGDKYYPLSTNIFLTIKEMKLATKGILDHIETVKNKANANNITNVT